MGCLKKTKLYAVFPLNKYHPQKNATSQLSASHFVKRGSIWYQNFIGVIFDIYWYLEQDHDKVLKLGIDIYSSN